MLRSKTASCFHFEEDVGANRGESDVQIRHRDQTWHHDVTGVAFDENSLHVVYAAAGRAVSDEERLRGVWMQTENRELLKGNPDSSWGNDCYY